MVQLYVQHLGSSVDAAAVGIEGIQARAHRAGADGEVKMELKARDLAYWDVAAHAWRVEKEQVRVLAGGSSDNLPVQAVVDIDDSGEFKP